MSTGTAKPIIFISYSREDRRWLEFVQGHLQVAATNDHFETWDDRRVQAGDLAAIAWFFETAYEAPPTTLARNVQPPSLCARRDGSPRRCPRCAPRCGLE